MDTAASRRRQLLSGLGQADEAGEAQPRFQSLVLPELETLGRTCEAVELAGLEPATTVSTETGAVQSACSSTAGLGAKLALTER